jgi:carbon storage regulator
MLRITVHDDSAALQFGEMNMLVLTRRSGEEIVIDGDIRVMVVAIKGDKIRLGISAPPSVTVDRSEVHERRGEFAYACDWTQPAPVDPFLENLASDLTDVAYRVALRHGVADQWLELQLDLWEALTELIEKRSCLDQEIQLPYDPRLDVDRRDRNLPHLEGM